MGAGLSAGGTAMLVVTSNRSGVAASAVGGRPTSVFATLLTVGEALAIKLLLEDREAIEIASRTVGLTGGLVAIRRVAIRRVARIAVARLAAAVVRARAAFLGAVSGKVTRSATVVAVAKRFGVTSRLAAGMNLSLDEHVDLGFSQSGPRFHADVCRGTKVAWWGLGVSCMTGRRPLVAISLLPVFIFCLDADVLEGESFVCHVLGCISLTHVTNSK